MEPVNVVTGTMAPLWRADIDTDQIMPKQFLKRIERTGFGAFVFDDWRRDPDFVLNRPAYAGAKVLVSGPNFGCGSSREHAPWGLQQYGFEVIVAPSFADIFRSNCVKIGLLTVALPKEECRRLVDLATAEPSAEVVVDLPAQTVTAGGVTTAFDIDPHSKRMLEGGLDHVGLTLTRDADISAFEADRPTWLPTTSAASVTRS